MMREAYERCAKWKGDLPATGTRVDEVTVRDEKSKGGRWMTVWIFGQLLHVDDGGTCVWGNVQLGFGGDGQSEGHGDGMECDGRESKW